MLEHKGKVHGTGFPCEHCGKLFLSKASRIRHVSVVHHPKQPISNNNKAQAVSDDHPPDNHHGNLQQQQEYKKKKEQEDIIKLLVEEELGMKLTIKSFIENMVLDEAWLKIQNKSPPPQQPQFHQTPPPQQQQQPPSQDHICCQGHRAASRALPTSPHSNPHQQQEQLLASAPGALRPEPPLPRRRQVPLPPHFSRGVFLHQQQPVYKAQEACAGQQVDPDRAEDQLQQVGHQDDHHRGDPLLQEAAAEGAVPAARGAEERLRRARHHEGAAAERVPRAAEDVHHRRDPPLQGAAAVGAVPADHTIEIDASYDSHSPIDWILKPVVYPKPDYSDIKHLFSNPQLEADPRLRRFANSGMVKMKELPLPSFPTAKTDPRLKRKEAASTPAQSGLSQVLLSARG